MWNWEKEKIVVGVQTQVVAHKPGGNCGLGSIASEQFHFSPTIKTASLEREPDPLRRRSRAKRDGLGGSGCVCWMGAHDSIMMSRAYDSPFASVMSPTVVVDLDA